MTKAKAKTKSKSTNAPLGESKIIAKLLASTRPEKLLDKLGVSNADLWRWFESGQLSLSGPIEWNADNRLEGVPPDPVIAIARTLGPDAMRDRSIRDAIATSYVDHSDAWEAALPALPPVVADILWCSRLRRGIFPADVRERVLAFYLEEAFTEHNSLSNSTAAMVEDVMPAPEWHRRVLARLAELGDAPPTHDIVIAFQFATWDEFFAYAQRHAADMSSDDVDPVLGTFVPSGAQLLAFRTLGSELDADIAWEVLKAACTHGEVAPPKLEDLVVEDFASCLDVEKVAAIMALPDARRKKFLARALADAEPCRELAGLMPDPKLDEEIVNDLVEAASGADWSDTRTLREIVPCQQHAITLIDRAWSRLTAKPGFETTAAGIGVRQLFRRVKFMATRGMADRPWHLVMPSADLQCADMLGDIIGESEPLSLMRRADIERLFAAYAPYDWDGTLGFQNYFDEKLLATHVIPPIETRPWQELVDLIAVTSFRRLVRGEDDAKTLSRLFNRPEPLADRIALAAAIAEREAAFAAHDPGHTLGLHAMMAVLGALAPHVIASKQPLPPVLADAALRILREDVSELLRDLLLALPRAQVDGWLHALSTDRKPTVKKRAKEYSKLFGAGGRM